MAAVALAVACGPIVARKASRPKSPSASRASAKPAQPGVAFSVESKQYRISVTALYRSGPFMRLGFRLECVQGSGDNSQHACEADEDFTSGIVGLSSDFGGFYLVDPVRHKEYLPVETEDGSAPFTSKSDYIGTGKAVNAWVVFPAPAPDAQSLDVGVPEGPVLENVPIGQPKPATQQAPTQPNFDKPKDTTSTDGLRLKVNDLLLRTTSEGTDEKRSKDRTNVTLAADVLFAFGKATLTSKAKTILGRVATQMDSDATGTIDVTGYTDAKGSPKVNNPLSENRAKAVADYLKKNVKRGLSYSVKGKGEADPIAPNTNDDGSDNPKGRAKNRRVTVSYKTQPSKTAGGSPAPTTSSAPPTQAPTAVVWTASGDEATDTYQVSAQYVHRHGDLAALHFTLTCRRPERSDRGCQPDVELQDPDHSGELAPDRAGGFRLYQPSSTTRYYPITEDAVGNKAWTSDMDSDVPTGTARSYWAYFPAPDPGATAIDVELPHGGPTIHNVPVE